MPVICVFENVFDIDLYELVPFAPPYGSSSRPRVTGRGQSKRGRPRGSRRNLGRPAVVTSASAGKF